MGLENSAELEVTGVPLEVSEVEYGKVEMIFFLYSLCEGREEVLETFLYPLLGFMIDEEGRDDVLETFRATGGREEGNIPLSPTIDQAGWGWDGGSEVILGNTEG